MIYGTQKWSRGVALVTALLVVALATTIAVAMVSRQQLDIRRTGNMLMGDQTRLYAFGAEAWGIAQLERDDNKTDSLEDDWATLLPPLALDEGGTISGGIEDLQGRFNLNTLIAEGDAGKLAQQRFTRLLKQLDLEPALQQAVRDWIDSDSEPSYPDGAEDNYYLGLTPAYRSANTPLASVSELRLIRGIETEHYTALAPHVTALPESNTALNINTATVDQLMTLGDDLVRSEIEALVEQRNENAFATVTQFLQDNAFAGREIKADALDVASHYFMIQSQTEIGRSRLIHQSLVQRSGKGVVKVLRRSQGAL